VGVSIRRRALLGVCSCSRCIGPRDDLHTGVVRRWWRLGIWFSEPPPPPGKRRVGTDARRCGWLDCDMQYQLLLMLLRQALGGGRKPSG